VDRVGARLGGSPIAAGDEEGDDAKPVKGSPGARAAVEMRCGVVTETNGGGSSSSHERRRVRESLKVWGRGAVRGGGVQGFI
jgi:hypothetical protein